jgi:hypothetical protein
LAVVVEEMVGLGEEGGRNVEKPQHFTDGLVQGGQVFYKTMKTGVTGLVDRPMEGASKAG